MAIDARRVVVRGRDAACQPIIEPPQRAQLVRHFSNAAPRLPLQLHDVELRYASFGPQIRGQPDLRQRVAAQIESQTFDPPGAEIPTAEDTGFGHAAQWFRHAGTPETGSQGKLGTLGHCLQPPLFQLFYLPFAVIVPVVTLRNRNGAYHLRIPTASRTGFYGVILLPQDARSWVEPFRQPEASACTPSQDHP